MNKKTIREQRIENESKLVMAKMDDLSKFKKCTGSKDITPASLTKYKSGRG